jgi:hypothetical protein
LTKLSIRRVNSRYIPSKKNSQVANFYDNLNFSRAPSVDDSILYHFDINERSKSPYEYIKIIQAHE